MLSQRLISWISIFSNIGCQLGASALRPDPLDPYKLIVDELAVRRVRKSFMMAVFWGIGGFFIVVKHYKQGNQDQLHLTMSWWAGYMLILVLYSVTRFFALEVCELYNSFFDFLLKVKGEI